MPRVRPLNPQQAARTFANRFARTADNLRQLNTSFGLRPTRVFLVWTRWSGSVRGEGEELVVRQVEILPTPKVKSLDAVTFSIFHAGTVPVGSVRLSEVSVSFTYDNLVGHAMPPCDDPCAKCSKSVDACGCPKEPPHADQIAQPNDFFYELAEDGRGDNPPVRQKFRPLSYPWRNAGNVEWQIMLEKIAEDRGRDGRSKYLSGKEGG